MTWTSPLSAAEEAQMDPEARSLLYHYQLLRLPVEGTLYRNTYRSAQELDADAPLGTAMIGLYCERPLSVSCFHCLAADEIWHVYAGDPFRLFLLYQDGTSQVVTMGTHPLRGELVQFVVPAGVWQAGELLPGGRFSLFGTSMAPGFHGSMFQAAIAEELIQQYPQQKDAILRLSVNGTETRMPEGFTQ